MVAERVFAPDGRHGGFARETEIWNGAGHCRLFFHFLGVKRESESAETLGVRDRDRERAGHFAELEAGVAEDG